MKRTLFTVGCCLVIAFGCKQITVPENSPVKYRVPAWWPSMPVPADNQPNSARMALGKKLFYEKSLSSNGKMSCASCHPVSGAFTDGRVTSEGAHGLKGLRNSPTLANLGWHPYYMAEGGVPTLELQVLSPVGDSVEMNVNILEVAHRLNRDAEWKALSEAAYGRELDAYVITRALACFQRSFISSDSRFDRFYYEKREELTAEEKKGMDLFFSERTQCASCHTPPAFTDYGFYNIGLYENYADKGKQRESYRAEDVGKFKTPTLRNIELTAPYMHNGSVNSLEEVVAFFNAGGHAHANKDPRIRPLNLSATEQEQLVSFLKTLTDWNFVQNVAFLPAE
jgi:cytochrome c peroxidase